MKMSGIPFGVTDWSAVAPTEHAGVAGKAIWRTREFGEGRGALRVRLVEYQPGYVADHWCEKGHIIYCIEGRLDTGGAPPAPPTNHPAPGPRQPNARPA